MTPVRLEPVVNVLKFQTLLFFCIRTEIHKMLFRIANREYPDQTASSDDLGSAPYVYSVQNFGTSIHRVQFNKGKLGLNGFCLIWVKIFRINPEFRILRLTELGRL